jgi:hypothetical protein
MVSPLGLSHWQRRLYGSGTDHFQQLRPQGGEMVFSDLGTSSIATPSTSAETILDSDRHPDHE